MDILYRNATPAYRGCSPQPQQRSTNILSGLWCYLFGSGTAPSYRTKGGKNGAAAPTAPRCWWQAFPATPQYKAAPDAPPHDDVPDERYPGGSDDGGAEDTPVEIDLDEAA